MKFSIMIYYITVYLPPKPPPILKSFKHLLMQILFRPNTSMYSLIFLTF